MMVELNAELNYLKTFENIGLKKDDVVFISSDIGKMAKACIEQKEKFNVDQLIDTLQNQLTEGTIIIPAYTDHLVDGDTFDYTHSKPTTGAVSNKVWKRKDFERSSDPLHSILVWGKLKDDVLQLNDESTFGKYSIFSLMHQVNAKFIFIDIHIQNCFTYIHYIEEQQEVKYRKPYQYEIKCVRDGNESWRKVIFYSKKLGVISDILDLHDLLEKNDVYESYQYRNSLIQILKADDVWHYASKCIKEGPELYRFSWVKYFKDLVKRFVLKKKGVF